MVAIVLVVLFIGGYRLYVYLRYGAALDDEEEQWVNEVFIPSKIVGVIYEFNDPSGDNCFSNLIVKQANGEKFASGVCVCNSSFVSFALVGDSILKEVGSKRILVKKTNGDKKEFDFPFCED